MKMGLKTILLSCLVSVSLFGNEIIIDKNSETGKVILNSDKEYKEYLTKIYANKNLEDIIYKHECDINMLKEAVAKLILALEKGANVNSELNAVSKKIIELENENKKLKDKLELPIEKQKILEEAVEGNFQKTEKSCVKEKVIKEYKLKDIKHSYINIIPDKTFKAQVQTLTVFKLPIVNSETESFTLSKGENFVADKYTKAGWVHIKSGGWVRGYEVYPKVLEEKNEVEYEETCK